MLIATIIPTRKHKTLKMDSITEHNLHGIALFLTKSKLLSQEKVLFYFKDAFETNQTLLCYLVSHNLLCSKTVALKLSQQFELPIFDLNSIAIESIPAAFFNKTLIQRHHMVPLFTRGNQLYVATNDPFHHDALKEIQFHTGYPVTPLLVETLQLIQFIETLLKQKENQDLIIYSTASDDEAITTVSNELDPIVKFVERILLDAIKQNVSDIHFEPYEQDYQIRYRQDGLLTTIATPPINLANRITSRIKIIANLDISERRVPQDGRFKLQVPAAKMIDFRVNSCPTVSGEKIVIRLLNKELAKPNIELLGFMPSQKDCFLAAISRPQGLILVTGPTGSGKTLTLYSALNILNTGQKNISTVEDPVEINVHGINQVNINIKTGLTFANTLRSLLRQDPDIIMIGEIRDLETAEIAVKAAQTGHLVLSTLHTNSAAETLTRFLNMGIPSLNIASSIRLIIAQRLIRLLCPFCKIIRTDLCLENLIELGLSSSDTSLLTSYKASGCRQCHNGYRGRIALFEMMPISKSLAQMIMTGKNEFDLLNQAKTEGMIPLFSAGIEQVKAGITSLEEVNRVMIN